MNTTTPNLADLLADLPPQSSIDALNTTTPNLADLMADLPPPPQSSIDVLNTATPNLADLPPIKHRCLEYHYNKLGRSTPLSIEHRCLEYCHTKLGRSTPPSQLSIDALNTATPNLADLPPIEHRCLEYCYTKLGTSTPQSIEHRCLEYCYTKLGRSTPSQSSIDALNTTTPSLADLLAQRMFYAKDLLPARVTISFSILVPKYIGSISRAVEK